MNLSFSKSDSCQKKFVKILILLNICIWRKYKWKYKCCTVETKRIKHGVNGGYTLLFLNFINGLFKNYLIRFNFSIILSSDIMRVTNTRLKGLWDMFLRVGKHAHHKPLVLREPLLKRWKVDEAALLACKPLTNVLMLLERRWDQT